jgi:AraC family transcriptional regulator of adaptative response/methylated-DNA-[protein]-cysteine methyltransferase
MNGPSADTMYDALVRRDSSYEGIFYAAVKTTGIFCRPTCRARKPERRNVEFFPTAQRAIERGYRPCKVCHPLSPAHESPEWLQELLGEVREGSGFRLSDQEIRARGIDPNRVRRWFKTNHGMTFQAYLRSIRLTRAFGRIVEGDEIMDAAFTGYESLSGFTDAFKKLTGVPPTHARDGALIHTAQMLTPLGPMLAASVGEGICLLEFKDRRMLPRELTAIQRHFGGRIVPGGSPHLEQLEEELAEYFEGRRRSFDVPLCAPGSPFQKSVWSALLEIPYGETRSYKAQAEAIGQPQAVRAVARANGMNRIAIVIPCHRVIGADGSLTGYGGGLERKRFLLELEGGARS